MSGPGVVLLTWNPGPHDDRRWTPLQWLDALVGPHRRGSAVTTTWGVGRHVNGFEAGEAALLLRQGAHGRGVVARGVLLGGPFPDPAATRNLVEVEWRDSVPLPDALEVSELERVAPAYAWHQVWSSGRHLPPGVGDAVLRAWEERVEDVRRGSA